MRLSGPGADNIDQTTQLTRRKRVAAPLAAVAVLAVLLAAAGGGWLLWPRPGPPPAPVAQQAPAFQITTADEPQIRDHIATDLTVFRFAANPKILVLDFASLRQQGEMLNRVAALIEKAGLPRDRVLTDAELDKAIAERGDTVETFYYGHDYAAASLVRFFKLADSQHIELDPEEERLRALMRQAGWFEPGVSAGLISLPAVDSDPKVTRAARIAILRHELSHGEFFSNPAYADYVHRFWQNDLTEAERVGVMTFLAKQDYDPNEPVLMYNEMQAYLMFTRDPMIFMPQMVGLTPKRLTELQVRFLRAMPPGWLHDLLASYQDGVPAQ